MSAYNEKMTEAVAPVDQLAPTNASAATANSGGIDMQKFGRCIFVIQVGVITGAGTLDAKLQTSANSNFNVVHNLNSITQVTNASPNTIVTVEALDEYIISQNSGDRYARLQCVVTTNNVYYGMVGYGSVADQEPANAQINTSVVIQQVVAQ